MQTKQADGKVVRVLGEGEEDGDEVLELIELLHDLHERIREAKMLGKQVQIQVSIV